jgi:putative peptidoglycan lipid II flippase
MPQPTSPAAPGRSLVSRLRGGQSQGSAAILLMLGSLLSGVLGLVRVTYMNRLFPPGVEQDALQAAYTLPDYLNYFLIGGAASISLITVFNRYRERGDDAGADRALSVILTNMLVVLMVGVVLGEIVAPWYITLANKGFRADPVRAHLATQLTRVILPQQLFFFIGSVMSARLQVRKIFIYQAFSPVIYNVGQVGGAFLLHRQLGVYSFAWGMMAGMLLGYALLNGIGAFRTGLRYTPRVDFRHPDFREWLRLSLPLMIGVSLVMFDLTYLKYFGSVVKGGISLLTTAKTLFNSSFNIIGAAAGAASLPFFTSLFQSGRLYDFSASVGRAVSRLFSVGLLVSAWMLALGPWLIDLLRGGKLSRASTAEMSHLFTIFAGLLGFWAIQGIYARAFYAASDTKTPAIAGTVITVAFAPVYKLMFQLYGLGGLAWASDLGIVVQTATLAILLHRHRLVSLLHLQFREIGLAAGAATAACLATAGTVHFLPAPHNHVLDIMVVATGSLVWLVVGGGLLHITGSALPAAILRRKAATAT